MILNPKKTTIGFSKRKMVGHSVSKNGVVIDPEKLDRILKFFFPTTKKPFEVFWGWSVIIKGSYTCLRQKNVL
jgi:hypothetical protein